MNERDESREVPTVSHATDADSRLEEILLNYFQAVDAGRPPDRRQFFDQYPDLADELRAFFSNQDAALGTTPNTALPAQVGRCQLLGELGHGGMGAVYRGRDTDLHRDVAVKVLLERHRDRPELAKRFVEEARIAGQLQHPGVTPVYELGAFPDRRPFFTMKLVQGQTLAALLAARKEPAEELTRFVGVFAQVCQAVAYAHARGVIHRDLKPANVMVGAFGEVQVMDWGLAKVKHQQQAPETVGTAGTLIHTGRPAGADTEAGRVLGTPAYMAPEQARGEVDTLDERCDVFGLGAILCVILTGQPAYTGSSGREVYDKARTAETAEALSRLEASGADAELLTLAKRCLAAAPADRPRNAGEVAAAVTAYQESVAERLRQAELARAAEAARAEEAKATAAAERRARQLTVRLSAAVVFTLLLGVAGTTWGMMRANEAWSSEAEQKAEAVRAAAAEKKAKEREVEQRRQAETARDNEARERRYAESIAHFVTYDFLALTSVEGQVQFGGQTLTRNATLRELLDRAAAKLNARKDLALRTQAGLCWIIGVSYASLGDATRAISFLERGVKLHRQASGTEAEATLNAQDMLVMAYSDAGQYDQAVTLHEETLKLMKAHLGPDHLSTLNSMCNLAVVYRTAGRLDQSVPFAQETLELIKARLGPNHPFTLRSMGNLAQAYRVAGKLDQAVPLAEKTFDLMKDRLGRDHPYTLTIMFTLAQAYWDDRRWDHALELAEEVFELENVRLGPDHPQTLNSLNTLAIMYLDVGKIDRAVRLAEKARTLMKDKLGPDHPLTLIGMNTLAQAYTKTGKPDRALPLLEEMLIFREKKHGPNHPDTLECLNNLAVMYSSAKQFDKSIPMFEKLWKRSEKINGRDHRQTLFFMANLGGSYRDAGRLEEAIRLLEEAHRAATKYPALRQKLTVSLLEAFAKAGEDAKFTNFLREQLPELRKVFPPRSPQLADQLAAIGRGYLDMEKWAEAEPLLRECLAIREKAVPELWSTFNVRSLLGGALLGQQKYAKAEPLLLAGYAGMKQREKVIPPQFRQIRLTEAAERLVQLYEATSQEEKAAEWRKKRDAEKESASGPG
jgi:tetratricopeptide (TPR) repeat protein